MGTAFLPENPASQGNPGRTGCTAPNHSMGLTLLHIDRPGGVSVENEDMLAKHQHQKTELHDVASHLPYLLTTSLKCSVFRSKTGIQIGR